MNCQKCQSKMKEYVGLRETGWDCTNPNCGKSTSGNCVDNSYVDKDGIVHIDLNIKLNDPIEFIPITIKTDDLVLKTFEEINQEIHRLFGEHQHWYDSSPATAIGAALDILAKDVDLIRCIGEIDEQLRNRINLYEK